MPAERPQHLHPYPLWLDLAGKWRVIPGGAIILIFGLVVIFSNCGGGGNKPPTTGVSFSVARSTNPPDAIARHAHAAFIAASLPSDTAPNEVAASCGLTGNYPSGVTAALGAPPAWSSHGALPMPVYFFFRGGLSQEPLIGRLLDREFRPS